MNAAPRSGLTFEQCLAVSFAAHALFFLLMKGLPSFSVMPPIEVEISGPFLGSGPAHLAAPKAKVEGAKGIPMPPVPHEAPVAPKVVEPQKDWVAPSPDTTKMIKPQENATNPTGADNVPKDAAPPTPGGVTRGTGISPLPGGSGPGAPFGTPNGTGDGGADLDEMPHLLNREEVMSNVRKYYPESERQVDHEGNVFLYLHIGLDGVVSGVDIQHADSPAFGAAAEKVARRMRFSPATRRGQPVPFKKPQLIQFQLER